MESKSETSTMEKQQTKKETGSNWKIWIVLLGLVATAAVLMMMHCASTSESNVPSFSNNSFDFNNLFNKGRVLSDDDLLSQVNPETLKDKATSFFSKRDDKKGPTPWYDVLAIRILLGIGVFAFLNVVAITVHHLVQVVSRSTSSYKEVQHDYSPF